MRLITTTSRPRLVPQLYRLSLKAVSLALVQDRRCSSLLFFDATARTSVSAVPQRPLVIMSSESTINASTQSMRFSEAIIGKLPSELLCAIFEFLRETWPMTTRAAWRSINGPRKHPQNLHIPLGWVVVSHVCQKWRYVTVGHRILWATLGLDFFDSWDVFLERSGPQLLVSIQDSWVKLGQKPSGYILQKHAAAMNQHAQRIRSVTAIVDVEVLKELWSELASTPPSLAYLELHVNPSDPAIDEIPVPIRLTTLLRHSPKLRTLNLNSTSGIHLDWSSEDDNPTSALRTVRLNAPCAPTTRYGDVLRTLQALGALEEIELREYTTLPFVDDLPSTVVNMQSLRRLSFINCNGTSLALWKHLQIVHVTQLSFRMPDFDDAWLGTFLTLAGDFLQARGNVFTRLRIEWGSEERRVDFKLRSEDGSQLFDVVLESDVNSDVLVQELASVTPMASLKTLTLKASDEAGSSYFTEDIRDMFDGAINLRFLALCGDILCPKICAYLGRDDTKARDTLPHLFPSLERMDIGSECLSFSHLSHRWISLPSTSRNNSGGGRWWHFEGLTL